MTQPTSREIRPPVSVRLTPTEGMDILSHREVAMLREAGQGGLKRLFRRCCLAVLNSGVMKDEIEELMSEHEDFDVRVVQQDRGIKLELVNAPAEAFVDGQIIEGIRELLFDVMRDVVFVHSRIEDHGFDLDSSEGLTDAVFMILRHAGALETGLDPNIIVCWGGHSIKRHEYDYTKEVGYELGLRGMDICTGCGPGAMKGPMKGAAVAHNKQRERNGRYIGISEPGIIAAESPNPIVNQLIIMPDIEKRLEAFVRLGHGIIVFPGGVGTAEEILYLMGILLNPDNADQPLPVVFTGPAESAEYFEQIDEFIGYTLGPDAQRRYKIIVNDPIEVARTMVAGMARVKQHRIETKDAFFYNWTLKIEQPFQEPFRPTHANMSGLRLHKDIAAHELAANLRRAFSGIVAGNVKEEGIEAIKAEGKYRLHGASDIMERMDKLLNSFIAQQRMKLPGTVYDPCYEVAVD